MAISSEKLAGWEHDLIEARFDAGDVDELLAEAREAARLRQAVKVGDETLARLTSDNAKLRAVADAAMNFVRAIPPEHGFGVLRNAAAGELDDSLRAAGYEV